jgi:hypothetical protein
VPPRLRLVVLLLGCTRWESYDLPPTPAPALPSYLRVSTPGRAPTVLVHPFVRLDTLYGRARADTLGFSLTAIERLERPRLDGLRTTAVVIGGLAAWIVVPLAVWGVD